jgi:methionyl aminopeptidase
MPAIIKNDEQIARMRIAGQLAARALEYIGPHVAPDIATETLDQLCHHYIVEDLNAIPAPLNYRGFPKSICTSINHVVCHGIPGPGRLKDGDIVNIDITVIKDGFHGDTSMMFLVGNVPTRARRLVEITHECLWLAIRMVRPGIRLGDLGQAIQQHAESRNCSVVREYCGHGIGLEFHEEPQVLHYGEAGTGLKLEPGMIFTIEPMINAGKRHVKLLPDNWTVITRDHSLSAQWEHTILVTDTGHEVLTRREGEAP